MSFREILGQGMSPFPGCYFFCLVDHRTSSNMRDHDYLEQSHVRVAMDSLRRLSTRLEACEARATCDVPDSPTESITVVVLSLERRIPKFIF